MSFSLVHNILIIQFQGKKKQETSRVYRAFMHIHLYYIQKYYMYPFFCYIQLIYKMIINTKALIVNYKIMLSTLL
uniref:Ovule protein n=1 Tax=Strongyloides papillosus TaxID=174720 RepID=A0A0N5BLH5_STREA